MKGLTMIVVAALAALSVQIGHADVIPADTLSKIVRYGELDLSRMQGVEVLHQKLRTAAKEVCSPLSGGDLKRYRKHRECVADALSGAIVEINQPMLTQYHEWKNGDTASVGLAQR